MIGRTDILFLFVVETQSGDSPELIQEELKRIPFSQPIFIDYKHDFIKSNAWLIRKKYVKTNDFLIDKSGRIHAVGDPTNDLFFLKYLKNYKT